MMEKMPFQPGMTPADSVAPSGSRTLLPALGGFQGTSSDWRERLPVLTSGGLTLRELRSEDAPVLFSMLSSQEVARFISPPPTSVEGFERFVAWTIREREQGSYVCFGVVPEGMTAAVGLFQVRALEPDFALAEWGFALGSAFWGTGTFVRGAQLLLRFAFDALGVQRLEARVSIVNGRGNGALRKVGALQEGVLRRAFLRNGQYQDQVLWSILADDWRGQRDGEVHKVH
ncbi:MAG: GNAT family N-acetyltransferase [Acidobacteriota bacterium]